MPNIPEQRYLDEHSLEEFWQWAKQYQQDSIRAAYPIGVATRSWVEGKRLLSADLVFATKDGAWITRIGEDKTKDDIIGGLLRKTFLVNQAPMLASREVIEDAVVLGKAMHIKGEEQAKQLASLFFFDLEGLSNAVGIHTMQRDNEWPLVLDALDSFHEGPQYESALSPQTRAWYKQVHLPIVRWKIISAFVRRERGEQRWVVKYRHLLYRVIAYFSSDPFLIRLFQEQEEPDPVAELARKLSIDQEQVTPFILWLCTGEDKELLQRRLPFIAPLLPDNPAMVKHAYADKEIPVIRLWSAEEVELARRREVEHFRTLAGRLPKDRSVSEMLYHKIVGTVQDLVDVSIASLLSMGEDNILLDGDEWWDRVKITVYPKDTGVSEGDLVAMFNWYDRLYPVPGGAKVLVE